MGLTLQWVFSARGDFERAVDSLKRDLRNSDLSNKLICRASNDRIMKVSVPRVAVQADSFMLSSTAFPPAKGLLCVL